MNKVPDRFSETLIAVARDLAARNWLRATSGNLSLRDPESGVIYITRSGVDKQRLDSSDIIGVTSSGTVVGGTGKPSFETAIHQVIYARTSAQAVFHVHTVYNNVAARYAEGRGLEIGDHEMLKALGHWGENARVTVPVIPNYADIRRVADAAEQALDPAVPAFLLVRHGIYAFGESVPDARRHLEALEFLFEWLHLDRMAQFAAVSGLPLTHHNLVR